MAAAVGKENGGAPPPAEGWTLRTLVKGVREELSRAKQVLAATEVAAAQEVQSAREDEVEEGRGAAATLTKRPQPPPNWPTSIICKGDSLVSYDTVRKSSATDSSIIDYLSRSSGSGPPEPRGQTDIFNRSTEEI
eukprot:6699297-Pyramimonas_sp.AAC.1